MKFSDFRKNIIKEKYIRGEADLKDLSLSEGVNYSTLIYHSRKGKWSQLKRDYQNNKEAALVGVVSVNKVPEPIRYSEIHGDWFAEQANRYRLLGGHLLDRAEALLKESESAENQTVRTMLAKTASVLAETARECLGFPKV